jgi:hypothetical protein
MKKICAWCKSELMAEDPNAPHPEQAVSHGMCRACAERMFSSFSEPLSDFLDRLDVPILLIEPEPRVCTANKSARTLLRKDLGQIEGRRGGEVIDCTYASTPEGCGNHQHCLSCTIRNTVIETFATGQPHSRVPAYPDIEILDDVKKFSMIISTEKVGNFVLLRIDELHEEKEMLQRA